MTAVKFLIVSKILASLKACTKQKHLHAGTRLHFHILKRGMLERNCYVASTLVNMYAKCAALAKAETLLDELSVRDVVSWSALIAGYAEHGQDEDALKCFERMQQEGILADAITYTCILKVCGSLGAAARGEQFHIQIVKQGLLGEDIILSSSLVDMYAKCGALNKAVKLFDELTVRNVVTWNTLIGGYAHQDQGEDAIKLYECMHHDGVLPDTITFLFVLQACGSIGAVDKGKQIHEEIVCQELLSKDIILGTALLDMYAKYGALLEAEQVFNELSAHDVASWCALIDGYTNEGQGEKALKCFEQMQCEGIFPNTCTFICLLKACSSTGAVFKGEQIQNEILKQGLLEKNFVLGAALVDMYAKCGALEKAVQVLDELPVRDVVSWSALIAGYAEDAKGEESLKCLEQMQQEGISPSAVTFICLFKACATLRSINKVKEFHENISRQGLLANNNFLGNFLVDLYATCGAVVEATQVLDKIPVRDVVSWNVLIAGCVQQGQCEKALECLEQMQYEGLSPNVVTFIHVLKACGNVGAIGKGKELHMEIVRLGLLDIMLDANVVAMYAKCGALTKAIETLEELPAREARAWNALIFGYIEQDQSREALECFARMQHEGLSPDTTTVVYVLKACSSLGSVDMGKKIHDECLREDMLRRNTLLITGLLDMYADCDACAKASDGFNKCLVLDTVTWNPLIAGYVQKGQYEEALESFRKMQNEGFSADAVTFTCILQACGCIRAVDIGEEIHKEILEQCLFEKDTALGNTLVDMYGKCGALTRAAQVLDELPLRNVISWNALMANYARDGHIEAVFVCFIHMQIEGLSPDATTFSCILKACSSIGAADKGKEFHDEILCRGLVDKDIMLGNVLVDMYAKCGELTLAEQVFDKLAVCDIVSWNALIAGYVQQGQCKDALKRFEQMRYKGIQPDIITFICILKVCGSIGAAQKGEEIYKEGLKQGFLGDVVLGTTVLDMYAKCGALAKAAQMLDELPERNVVSWNALLAGFAEQGCCEEVVICFEQMKHDGLFPNNVTLICLLNACSRSGLLDAGQGYFMNMVQIYGVIPNVKHYTSLIDLFCRAGEFEKAITVIWKMPSSDLSAVWHSLLGACGECGNVNLGRYAYDNAICFDQNDAATYVLMSRICAAADTEGKANVVNVLR